MKKIIIAIDGWSSCGKSTLAKQMAKELNYTYVDSGAMYRAITLYFVRKEVDFSKKESVLKALEEIELCFKKNGDTHQTDMCLNKENVEQLIRGLDVAAKVCDVAAIKEVRDFAVAQQQKMGVNKGIIMDGRDIGTIVFPDAELKIFMTADTGIRTERRFKELVAKNKNITLEEVAKNIQTRDRIDSTREINPLRQAEDAIVIDNTYLTHEQQLQQALELAYKAMKS